MEPSPLRVLIAEDDFLIALLIEEELRAAGASVVGRAQDGCEAVELACRLGPDAVLMDVEMPRMGGVEASRELQQRRPTPVVLLTAYGVRDAASLAAEAGAGACLTKPAAAPELLAAIRTARARFEGAAAGPSDAA